jgi:hypothetical protein
MPNTALYSALLVFFIVTVVAFVVWGYGSPVSRKGLSELKITSNPSGRPATVSVDGSLISSSLAVSSVTQHRQGRCIVVIVREGIIRRGRTSGKFHLDIAVSDDIEELFLETRAMSYGIGRRVVLDKNAVESGPPLSTA